MLTDVTIGNKVKTIGALAFSDCGSLTSIAIPEGVTTIGDSAFVGCGSLESVTIPDSVTTIGWSAFNRCGSLDMVMFKNKSGWYVTKDDAATSGTNIAESDLEIPPTAAIYLTSTYSQYYWKRG